MGALLRGSGDCARALAATSTGTVGEWQRRRECPRNFVERLPALFGAPGSQAAGSLLLEVCERCALAGASRLSDAGAGRRCALGRLRRRQPRVCRNHARTRRLRGLSLGARLPFDARSAAPETYVPAAPRRLVLPRTLARAGTICVAPLA